MTKFQTFRAATAEDYENSLKQKTTFDLCEEAIRHGLRPDPSNRKRIERSLLEEYRRASRANNAALAQSQVTPISEEKREKLEKMLEFIGK